MPKSLDEILTAARLPEDTLSLCLRGDLQDAYEVAVAEFEELDAAIGADADAERANTTQGMAKRRRDAAKKVTDLEDEMREHSIEFRLRGLSFAAYNALMLRHPPKAGMAGAYEPMTFLPALIRKCIVEPTLTDEQWQQITDHVTDSQFDQLAETAIGVNRRADGSVPFSQRASEVMRVSAGTSRSRGPSA